ncbi:hypothetical protein EYF80_019406 [Liparis tanakae]|uniref:Uncharacterized protein n=1 Tax=Liparis tanakae TaxID=230148 RepID=A0A4Z2HXX2_9TELE|nr:hypothetical protein EYF80_019406 [Liparis tanakae]
MSIHRCDQQQGSVWRRVSRDSEVFRVNRSAKLRGMKEGCKEHRWRQGRRNRTEVDRVSNLAVSVSVALKDSQCSSVLRLQPATGRAAVRGPELTNPLTAASETDKLRRCGHNCHIQAAVKLRSCDKLGCYLISSDSFACLSEGDRGDEMRGDCMGSHPSCYKHISQEAGQQTPRALKSTATTKTGKGAEEVKEDRKREKGEKGKRKEEMITRDSTVGIGSSPCSSELSITRWLVGTEQTGSIEQMPLLFLTFSDIYPPPLWHRPARSHRPAWVSPRGLVCWMS